MKGVYEKDKIIKAPNSQKDRTERGLGNPMCLPHKENAKTQGEFPA